ncbi:MAG: class I SAM-dependent DNA methyltransferase [Gammaproteobacteria bacterium]
MTNKKRLLDQAYTFDHSSTVEHTREFYDEWAEVYDEELVTEQGYAMPERCAAALARFATPSQLRVLDIGCGTGLSGKALHAVGARTMDGCDISPGMLEKASELNLYDRLFVADLTRPPLDVADASYDAATVVGVYSFGHLHADTTETILRAVASGGLVVIGVNDHFYGEGSLRTKLDALEHDGFVTRLLAEHGAHLPVKGVEGWVFVLRKT